MCSYTKNIDHFEKFEIYLIGEKLRYFLLCKYSILIALHKSVIFNVFNVNFKYSFFKKTYILKHFNQKQHRPTCIKYI